MNEKLMWSFRAPRGSKGRAKPPETESEEETALGVVSERCIIKETEEAVANKRGAYKLWKTVRDGKENGEDWVARADKEEMILSGPDCWSMVKERALAEEDYVPHQCSQVLSPSLSDFEAYLDKLDAARNHITQDDSDSGWEATDLGTRPGVESLDDLNSRMIGIEDILLHESSDDDNIPIVITLPSLATKVKKGKKKTKTLWTYETVVEPTGEVSKYWDGGTAVERATKRIAKQRLVESARADAIVESARSEDIVPEMPVKDRSWLIGVATLGVSVARDFGPPRRVVCGKIVSADDSRIPHSYHCNYIDGEEADLSRDELLAGYELFGAIGLGTYKPVQVLECNGSSEEEAACEDAWSDDSEHESKAKRRAIAKKGRQPKTFKRKASPSVSRGDLPPAPKKKAKKNNVKDAGAGVKKLSVKSSFTVADVLTTWTDASDFGAAFRSMNEADQKKELAQINLGAAKGIKGAVKTKVLKAQYKDLMGKKMQEYIKGNMVQGKDMFRANVVSYRAAQILRPGFLSVGEWVEVDADRTPGWNSEGGIAVIINAHDNYADVK
jgi:hypothetical protein